MTALEARAYHEAGHVVVARALGLVVTRAHIVSSDPAGGIVSGGVTDIDLDASRRQLGVLDLDDLRAQTFVAGSVVQARIQGRAFSNVFVSDGIGDLIALLSIIPQDGTSQRVVDAANYINQHGHTSSPTLEEAWDTCFSWIEEYWWVAKLYEQVARLVDTSWANIHQEARRLIADVRPSSTT